MNKDDLVQATAEDDLSQNGQLHAERIADLEERLRKARKVVRSIQALACDYTDPKWGSDFTVRKSRFDIADMCGGLLHDALRDLDDKQHG